MSAVIAAGQDVAGGRDKGAKGKAKSGGGDGGVAEKEKKKKKKEVQKPKEREGEDGKTGTRLVWMMHVM